MRQLRGVPGGWRGWSDRLVGLAVRRQELDAATDRVTAFRTWREFVARCRTGYVPTLRADSREGLLLADALRAEGLRVWCPGYVE
jgi:hypothetical protein